MAVNRTAQRLRRWVRYALARSAGRLPLRCSYKEVL